MPKANDFIILIVDDDALDVEIFCLALRKIDQNIQTVRAIDSQHAKELLNQLDSELSNRRLVIFLDLNMPRMNGLEFLSYLRGHRRYSGVPVLVFSTSDQPPDISSTNQHNVTGYITKKVGLDDTETAISSLIDFLNLIEIPTYHPPLAAAMRQSQSGPCTRRVLIVDDDELDMDLVKKAVTKQGADSHWVFDMEAALKELERAHYNAVVSDFRLGLSDADELVAVMKDHPLLRAIPILVTSAARPSDFMMPNIVRHRVPLFEKSEVASAAFARALAQSLNPMEFAQTLN